MIHQLKIEPEWRDRVLDGQKVCEVRHNDRDYQAGDEVVLVCGETQVRKKITHVLKLSDVPDMCGGGDWVVLSFGWAD